MVFPNSISKWLFLHILIFSNILKIYIRLSNSHHGTKLWASQDIFDGLLNEPFLKKRPYSRHNPMVVAPGASVASKPMGARTLPPQHHVWCSWDLPRLIKTSRTSLVRNNERYLAFSPAVSEAFLEETRIDVQFLVDHL